MAVTSLHQITLTIIIERGDFQLFYKLLLITNIFLGISVLAGLEVYMMLGFTEILAFTD